MKHKLKLMVTLIFLLMSLIPESVFAGGAIKFGADFMGEHEVSGLGITGKEDVDTGFSLTGELFGAISQNVDIGGGITWQIPRSQKDYEGDFSFIPIYGLLRFRSSSETIAPYITGQIGYNLYFGDSDYVGSGDLSASLTGGLYYGIGGGIIFKNGFLIEVLYSVNNGTGEIMGTDFDIEYSKISILLGFNF